MEDAGDTPFPPPLLRLSGWLKAGKRQRAGAEAAGFLPLITPLVSRELSRPPRGPLAHMSLFWTCHQETGGDTFPAQFQTVFPVTLTLGT